MALVPGNIPYLAFAVQADKDTPETAPTIAIDLEDSSIDPNIQELVTAESDRSAQQGQRIRVGVQPGGTFRKYVRPSEEGFFLAALLGTNASPYSIDPDAPFFTPYLTVWDVWPGVSAVRFDGCRISQAVYSSAPGQAVDAEYTLVGLDAVALDAEPDVTGLIVDELPYTWPEFTAQLDGSDPHTVNSFSLTASRNTGRFPGDNGLHDYDVPNGLVVVSGSSEIAFETDEITRESWTGSTTGTEITTAIGEKELHFTLTRGSAIIDFLIAAAQISNVRTAMNTDASPAVTTFDFQSKRQEDITDVLSVSVSA